MKIDISKLPYKHRFAAASMLMSRGNRLTELMSLPFKRTEERDVSRVLEGLSFYDMALSLIKPYDPNYQTLLHWKCQALISIGQFEDAKEWYEELLRIAAEAEGPNFIRGYAKLAQEQVAVLAGKKNEPLPDISRLDVKLFDDPPFCAWAEQFCWLLRDRKFTQAHRYLSANLGNRLTPSALKKMWSSLIGSAGQDVDIFWKDLSWGLHQETKTRLAGVISRLRAKRSTKRSVWSSARQPPMLLRSAHLNLDAHNKSCI
jgi:tetratricopeptide (TPR) repeat protein